MSPVDASDEILSPSSWRLVGVSVPGTSHLKSGLPCHDSCRYKLLNTNYVILIVADGAGSAAQAEFGSKLVADVALTSLEHQFLGALPENETEWQLCVQSAYQAARDALEKQANATETVLRDYATTLLAAVLTQKWTVVAMIGDGVAVTLDNSDRLVSLCQPQKGEYANQTNFLTQDNWSDCLDIRVLPHPVAGMALLSDGLLSLALNISNNRPYAPFFKPLFNFVAAIEDEHQAKSDLAEFLNSDRVNARTDDDKTLVLAWKVPEK